MRSAAADTGVVSSPQVATLLSRNVKNAVLRVSGQILRRTPMSVVARRFFRARANVIFYHGVWADDDPRRALFGGMRVSDFAAEMRRLKSFFHIVPLSEILHDLKSPRTDGRPTVAVTFDDGLDLTSAGATDVMDHLGIRATMFVNTASVAGDHLMWMQRFSAIRAERGDDVLLGEINRIRDDHQAGPRIDSLRDLIGTTRAWPQERKEEWAEQIWGGAGMPPLAEFLNRYRPYLNAEALHDWLKRGHEIGFHTHSHPFCSRLSDDLLEREVIEPVAALKATFGLKEVALAYPFGDRCRPEHENLLRDRGVFSALVGTEGFSLRPTDPLALERTEAEAGVDQEVFGKSIVRAYKRRVGG